MKATVYRSNGLREWVFKYDAETEKYTYISRYKTVYTIETNPRKIVWIGRYYPDGRYNFRSVVIGTCEREIHATHIVWENGAEYWFPKHKKE